MGVFRRGRMPAVSGTIWEMRIQDDPGPGGLRILQAAAWRGGERSPLTPAHFR